MKNNWITYFKHMNCMVYKLYLNKYEISRILKVMQTLSTYLVVPIITGMTEEIGSEKDQEEKVTRLRESELEWNDSI